MPIGSLSNFRSAIYRLESVGSCTQVGTLKREIRTALKELYAAQNELSHEFQLMQVLIHCSLASNGAVSQETSIERRQLEEQVQDWLTTNAPIGAASLLDAAKFFDSKR